MQKTAHVLVILMLFFLLPYSAAAHFGMVIPEKNTVTPEKRTVSLELSFSHPFEGIGMPLEKPAAFYVVKNNKKNGSCGCVTKKQPYGPSRLAG